MKKLLLLMFVVGISLSFSACEEDPLNEINPQFDLQDVKATDVQGGESGEGDL